MSKILRVLAGVVGVVIALAIWENADSWKQLALLVCGAIAYVYYELSRQIRLNHEKLMAMLEELASRRYD